ncbi:prolipoprotein diacylglyceryl transferase [Lactococcus hodotermopsidis]|uniref:Phosphatidylglycerol--prolipoprotein diacylglyceryl transferase n=1 Tax=Pseudolactococcus hodotermopsidis TaxID=2709157 RepID=A0A6A0BCK6_9LACT|nr:prolipoprotein diacylglyceryl transferase [Lactococcus hodotermopsidis]GFH42385.1 prolipoprotein diacylglyceryl transferase [Lactococcus hodotermopsidis]
MTALLSINPTAFELGPFEIRWYALCIVTGVIVAVLLAMKEAPSKKIKPDDVLDFILIAFPVAILGSRLYYVLFELGYYRQHPAEIFAVWHGGLAIYGGLLAGGVVLVIFSYYKLIAPLDLLDIAIPGVLIAQAMGRWGNFFNQEAFGRTVNSLNYLPEFIKSQMFIDGSYRTPTFLYESTWNIFGFAVIMIFRHRIKKLKSGDIFAFYLVWYGIGRSVIEGMRTDSLMLGNIRVSQALSLILILVGMLFAIFNHRKLLKRH